MLRKLVCRRICSCKLQGQISVMRQECGGGGESRSGFLRQAKRKHRHRMFYRRLDNAQDAGLLCESESRKLQTDKSEHHEAG